MSALVRHPLYYLQNGTHIFRVENTLYKLHSDVLMLHSALLKDMFTIGDAGATLPIEGKSDADPIFLEGEQQVIFDLFLDRIYGRSRNKGSDDTYTREQLQDMLQFADKYRCPMMRRFAIDRIWRARHMYHPAELVRLGCQFNTSKLFQCGFKSLLYIRLQDISKEHRREMGNDVFIALAVAKSLLDRHTRIIANEEPVILAHADDCQDTTACEEDWHAVWWNGMGRFLLDGRNPQPFGAAVERFREMRFGRMGAGCKKLMFQILDRGVGFRHADEFIADICNRLVDQFHLTDE